jgi:hypothetical protein
MQEKHIRIAVRRAISCYIKRKKSKSERRLSGIKKDCPIDTFDCLIDAFRKSKNIEGSSGRLPGIRMR